MNMSYEIRELLRLNVEMEGLLRVLAERDKDRKSVV